MFLYQRPNGIWYVHYDLDGRHLKKTTKCKTKSDALKFLKNFRPEEPKQESIKAVTVIEFMKTYLAHAESRLTAKSVKAITGSFRCLLDRFGNRPLRSFRVPELTAFIADRQQEHSVYSARHLYTMMASAFQTAVKWDIIMENPFRKIQKPKIPQLLPLYFSKDDFQQFLSVVDDPLLKDIAVFAVLSCMRLNEILHLEWNNIDFKNRLMHIINKTDFKTKSRKNRTVPMHSSLVDLLQRRQAESSSSWVFSMNEKRICADVVTKRIKKLIRKSGVNPKLHFHSFRHTGASWLVQANVSIFTVSKILGHSSVSTTMIYAHFAPEQMHGEIEMISI